MSVVILQRDNYSYINRPALPSLNWTVLALVIALLGLMLGNLLLAAGTSITTAYAVALVPTIAGLILATMLFTLELFDLVLQRLVKNPYQKHMPKTSNVRLKNRYARQAASKRFCQRF